ncbi:MAG: 30S ribosomal protein S5 [Candidatus Burarchaeum sp.]|nr:30S ribosomal protein S5 [Candidatus Burarchaeum sp.]MDO8339379.1 30S ribosomal protein S5 [Candidatus Burarchaeum sp.]
MVARRNPRYEEEEEAPWTPKTDIGKKVANHEIVSIKQVLESGKPIREHQLVTALLPNLTQETLEIKNTQRMTGNGRKMQFRAVVLVGDGNGHLGIGAGKADEVRPAISSGAKLAKRNIIHVPLGCGSWECGCKTRHTVPIRVVGKNGSVEIMLKPAPLGVGIVANATVRKVLHAAGVKDVWTFSRGRTSSIYNTTMAVFKALDSLNNMKYYDDWERNLKSAEPANPAAETKETAAQDGENAAKEKEGEKKTEAGKEETKEAG